MNFYLHWLRLACIFTIMTGITSLLASYPTTDFVWRELFNLLNLYASNIDFDSTSRALNAVLGGVMIGWGWMMFCLSHPKIFNESIRKIMLSALIIWFFTDSLGSYASGLVMNIVLNIVFLCLFLIPLVILKEKDLVNLNN